MTRDELRGLLGGYATGSLSEAERKVLFAAALEDQELFDELAGEQALKEALDQPGAKQRLISALAPKSWWRMKWVWAATAAATVAVLAGIALLQPPTRARNAGVDQIAEVDRPASPEPPRATPAPAASPRQEVRSLAPKLSEPPLPSQPARRSEPSPVPLPARQVPEPEAAAAPPPAPRAQAAVAESNPQQLAQSAPDSVTVAAERSLLKADTAKAQTAGTLTGRVTDPAGSVIAGVPVVATNVDTATKITGTTSAAGQFSIPQLPAGKYEVTIAAPGFKTLRRENVTIAAAQTLRLDLPMEVGSAAESVTVTAEATLLKTETAPTPPPPGAQAFAGGQADAFLVNGTTSVTTGQLSAPAAGAAARGGRGGGGGGGGRGGGRGGAAAGALLPVTRFAFDYGVTPERALRIVPAANGFLTVGFTNGTTTTMLFAYRPVQAGAATEIPVPADAVLGTVIFSAQSTGPSVMNFGKNPPDTAAGTLSDLNPSPASRLTAVFPVNR